MLTHIHCLTHACGAVAVSPCSANMARKTLRVVSAGQYSSRTDCDRACNLANLASSPAQLCALCRPPQCQHHLQVTVRCPTPAKTSPLNLMTSLRLLDARAPAYLSSLLQVSVGPREECTLPWPSRTGSARPTRRFESPGRPWRESPVLISECEAHPQLAQCRPESAAGGWLPSLCDQRSNPFLVSCGVFLI